MSKEVPRLHLTGSRSRQGVSYGNRAVGSRDYGPCSSAQDLSKTANLNRPRPVRFYAVVRSCGQAIMTLHFLRIGRMEWQDISPRLRVFYNTQRSKIRVSDSHQSIRFLQTIKHDFRRMIHTHLLLEIWWRKYWSKTVGSPSKLREFASEIAIAGELGKSCDSREESGDSLR